MNEDQKTPLTPAQVGALMANIHGDRVKTLRKGGRGFSYVEAYDIRATLIRLFGFGGFSVEVIEYTIQSVERDIPKSSGNGTTAFRVTATATTRLTIPRLGCVYTETAAANQSGSEPGEVMDFAIKTAASDALKRCAANLGTQFGLSLYEDGKQTDIVRVLFDTDQKEALATYREEAAESDKATRAAAQAIVNRATGAHPQDQPGQAGVHPEATTA